MTTDLQREREYRRIERLGILCGAAVPTPEQDRIAREEADELLSGQEAMPQGLLWVRQPE